MRGMFFFVAHVVSITLAKGQSTVSFVAYAELPVTFDLPERTLVFFNSKDSAEKELISPDGDIRGPFGDLLVGFYSPNNKTLKLTATNDRTSLTFHYTYIPSECTTYEIWSRRRTDDIEKQIELCSDHPSYQICTDFCREDKTHDFCKDICEKVPKESFCGSDYQVLLANPEKLSTQDCMMFIPELANIEIPASYSENPAMTDVAEEAKAAYERSHAKIYVLKTPDTDTVITLSEIRGNLQTRVYVLTFIVGLGGPLIIMLFFLCCSRRMSPNNRLLFLRGIGRQMSAQSRAYQQAHPDQFVEEPQMPSPEGMTDDEFDQALQKYMKDKDAYDKLVEETHKRELEYDEWMRKHPMKAARYMMNGKVWKPKK